MEEQIIFQKAMIDDVDTFLELEKKVAHIGWTEYTIKNPEHGYLGGLIIDPAYQGQGIARQAIEFRLNKLKDIKRIDLVTHPHNSKVIRLYLTYGFVIEAWKDNYYGDGEPRLVLVLNR